MCQEKDKNAPFKNNTCKAFHVKVTYNTKDFHTGHKTPGSTTVTAKEDKAKRTRNNDTVCECLHINQ